MAGNLARRIGFAAVAIPAALGLVYWGGWPLVALVALVGVLGVREVLAFAVRHEIRPLAGPAYLTAALVAPLAHLALTDARVSGWWSAWWPYVAVLWLLGVLLWLLAVRRPTERPMAAVATTVFAVAYAAVLPAFLVAIRHGAYGLRSWPGTWLVFFPLIVTWVSDSFAMFGGMLIGGPRLAPVVSPGKTRAGGVAGLAGAALVGVVFGWWVFPTSGILARSGAVVLAALLLSVVGQLGDLVESLLKRDAGLKDSGTLIPGHGGILDRFDSLYFVLPVTACLYRALGIG